MSRKTGMKYTGNTLRPGERIALKATAIGLGAISLLWLGGRVDHDRVMNQGQGNPAETSQIVGSWPTTTTEAPKPDTQPRFSFTFNSDNDSATDAVNFLIGQGLIDPENRDRYVTEVHEEHQEQGFTSGESFPVPIDHPGLLEPGDPHLIDPSHPQG